MKIIIMKLFNQKFLFYLFLNKNKYYFGEIKEKFNINYNFFYRFYLSNILIITCNLTC